MGRDEERERGGERGERGAREGQVRACALVLGWSSSSSSSNSSCLLEHK